MWFRVSQSVPQSICLHSQNQENLYSQGGGFAPGNPGFLHSPCSWESQSPLFSKPQGTQHSDGVAAITAGWASRRGADGSSQSVKYWGKKKKKIKNCSKCLGERRARQEGNGGRRRVLPCAAGPGAGSGEPPWLQEGPCTPSPAIIVLPHGAGNCPTVEIKDVDSAVEIHGSHGLVAPAPNLLAVPGAASPRYGSAP